VKLALSADGPGTDARFSERFGRCSWFVFLNSESGELEFCPNPATGSTSGAGAQASQFVAEQGADAVISGRFGPNAYQALHTAGIEMYISRDKSVKEVLDKFHAGLLQQQTGAPEGRGGRGGRSHHQRRGP
jgi:predicted Fe-Mo cluster-binding NifX family protein